MAPAARRDRHGAPGRRAKRCSARWMRNAGCLPEVARWRPRRRHFDRHRGASPTMARRSGRSAERRCVGGASTSSGTLSGRRAETPHRRFPPSRSHTSEGTPKRPRTRRAPQDYPVSPGDDDPHGQRIERNLGEHVHEPEAAGDAELCAADADAVDDGLDLGEQVVGAKGEMRRREPELADRAQPRRIAVGADERVLGGVSGATSACRGARDTTCSRRARPPRRRLLRDQIELVGPEHAYGDVRLAP